jgi:hypothetical protein
MNYQTLHQICKRYFSKEPFILLTICILLWAIPSLFWGKLFIVGGDDSRLYYLFPLEFIQNYAVNIISNNTLGTISGYSPSSFFIPFVSLVYIIKSLHIFNVQLFMYGLNLALGFLFYYLFLSLWIKNDNKNNIFIKIIGSLFYIFSIFIQQSLYTSQLSAVYLVSIIPATYYFFIKSIYAKKIVYVLISVILFSLFSISPITFPWSLAAIVATIPLFGYIFWLDKKRFLIHSVIFIVIYLLLNTYWLVHYLYAYTNQSNGVDTVSFYTSSQFRQSNIHLIRVVSGVGSQALSFINISSKNMYALSNNFFLLCNAIFILLVIVSGTIKEKSKYNIVYIVSLLCLLSSLYFYSPAIGDWGINLFLFFNEKIPGFTILRNMYDKFSLAMAFSFAFVFAISLVIIFEKVTKTIQRKILLLLILGIILSSSLPFILPQYKESKMSTRINDFNSEFYSLIDYVKHTPNASRFLWMPFNNASYVVIEDETLLHHYYWGPSPLQFLANKNDYTGSLSFTTARDPALGPRIFDDITGGNYTNAAKEFQKFNVKYIIVNHTLTKKTDSDHFLFNDKFYDKQMGGFKKEFLGRKIKDFGRKYTLYEVNSRYANDKLFLSDSLVTFPSMYQSVEYSKISSYKYLISIKYLKEQRNLVFLDPYQNGWSLYFAKDNKPFMIGKTKTAFDYANGWSINPDIIKQNYPNEYKKNMDGSIDVSFILYFEPQKIANIGYIISFSIFCLLLALIGYLRHKK